MINSSLSTSYDKLIENKIQTLVHGGFNIKNIRIVGLTKWSIDKITDGSNDCDHNPEVTLPIALLTITRVKLFYI